MKGRKLIMASFAATMALCAGCGGEDDTDEPQVISGAGDIRPQVEEFKRLLGGPDNGGEPGVHASGHRELIWDSVPDERASPFFLPSDFFNAAAAPRARGAILTTPGTGVQVSADSANPSGAAVRFGNINPSYAALFQAYSPERLFSPIGSNAVDLTFFVPGTAAPAVVRGFGAVYVDVDNVHNTAFEYFDADGRSLGQYDTPVANGGVSFLGVVFPEPVVHRVHIAYGNSPLGPDEAGSVDVAVMDNFIYGEPQPLSTKTSRPR